jgi:Holliday junction resolvase-like predicted endonuclease
VATDVRRGHWQADILAWDGTVPVVVEVKTRRGPGRPEAGLGPRQAARLIKLGRSFFGAAAGPVRLDLVAVRIPRDGPPQVDLFPDRRLVG